MKKIYGNMITKELEILYLKKNLKKDFQDLWIQRL